MVSKITFITVPVDLSDDISTRRFLLKLIEQLNTGAISLIDSIAEVSELYNPQSSPTELDGAATLTDCINKINELINVLKVSKILI